MTLSGATIPGQSGPRSNGNLLLLPQISMAGASPSYGLMSYPRHLVEVLLLCKDAVGVFCSPSQLASSIAI